MENQPTPTYRIGPPPAVVDPHPTTVWLVRNLLDEIKQLWQAVVEHQPPRGVAIVRAQAIADAVEGLKYVHRGREKVDVNDIPAIEQARDELAALLASLPNHAPPAAPVPPADAPLAPVVALRPGDQTLPAVRPATAVTTHEQAQGVLHLVQAERAQLPHVAHAWWPFSDSHRRIRDWTRAWKHTFNHPINEDRLTRAWQAYTARWNPPSPPENGPHHA